MDIFNSEDSLQHVANLLRIPETMFRRVKANAEYLEQNTVEALRKLVLDFIMEGAFRNRYMLMTSTIHADGLFQWANIAIEKQVAVKGIMALAEAYRIPLLLWLWALVVGGIAQRNAAVGLRYQAQIRSLMRPPHVMFQYGVVLPDGLEFNPKDVAYAEERAVPEEIKDIQTNAALKLSSARLRTTAWLRTSRRGVWLNSKRVHDMAVVAAARIPGRHNMALLVQPSGLAHLVTVTATAQDLQVLLSFKLPRPRRGVEAEGAGAGAGASDTRTYVPSSNRSGVMLNPRGIHSMSLFRRTARDPRVIVAWSYRSVDGSVGIVDDMLTMVLHIPAGRRPLRALPAVVACKRAPPIHEMWDDYFLSGDPAMSFNVHENVLYGVTTITEERADEFTRQIFPRTTIGYGENRCIFRVSNAYVSAVWGTPHTFFLCDRSGRITMYTWSAKWRKYGEVRGVGPKTSIRGTCTALVPLEASLLI